MVGSKTAKSVNCIREEKRQLASEDRTRSRVRRGIRSRRACHRSRTVIFMCKEVSQSGRLARPSSLFFCILQLLLTGKFGRQESKEIISIGVRSLGAPVSLYGPLLILHNNVLVLGAQVPVSVYFCVSTRSLNRWRSISNIVSFSRKFTSPSRCSMSASWLKTWTAVWPPLLFVSESGYDRNRPQPSNPNRNSIIVHQCLNSCSH